MSAPARPENTERNLADGAWHRVHLVSPLVRGWFVFVILVVAVGRPILERGAAGMFGAPGARGGRGDVLVPLLIMGGGAIVIVVYFLIAWRVTLYQVTGEHVRTKSGVIFKQNRQARLDKVQAVDISQPLLARLFGLAELKFEVADAGESAVRLAYLGVDDARQLRATILGRASGIEMNDGDTRQIPEAPEIPVLQVPPKRTLIASLLNSSVLLIVVGVLVFAVLIFAQVVPVWTLFSFIIALVGMVAAAWGAFASSYNFSVAKSPDGLRLRAGLLDTRAQTVPPGRIQAVKITQPFLWRFVERKNGGLYQMSMNVAGYGAGSSSSGEGAKTVRTVLLPVGSWDQVLQIMNLVIQDPGSNLGPGGADTLLRNGIHGLAPKDGSPSTDGYTTSPRRVRFISPLGWRRNGFASTDRLLVTRRGRALRNVDIVPHQKVQSVTTHRGPLSRKFDVLTLRVQTTDGPVSPAVIQADLAVGERLFIDEIDAATASRRRVEPAAWMRELQQVARAQREDAAATAATADNKDTSVE
ncbi:PH domain-containing protein [Haematomicrobium sanguinis]|uniref:PH domain-containing protein n=1 Tax=Haematomicrobium sanguinis TaxID=479106 RepID=UPI0006914A0B|nr:PH domain-containing protein [Haematomicrobium sanguinis]